MTREVQYISVIKFLDTAPSQQLVVVVAHSSSSSLDVVELQKISHRVWIVPYM